MNTDFNSGKFPAEPVLLYASAEAAIEFATRLLLAHDVPDNDARIVAECLVRADLRGVDTHGLVRLPGYLHRVRRGLINPRPQIGMTRTTPVCAAVDGQNGFGYVVATRAMSEAIASARAFGVGIAGARLRSSDSATLDTNPLDVSSQQAGN